MRKVIQKIKDTLSILSSSKGFTLLELLVVVLIIGILAAIALPQYKKSVEKSKATQALTLLQSLYQSAQVYQLTNGNWPSSIDILDIDIPNDIKDNWSIWTDNAPSQNTLGIGMTKKYGKYAGTGFAKYKEHSYNSIPKNTNLCIERKKNGTYIFTGEQGSYCNKILGGKGVYVGTSNNTNIYALI